MKFILLLISLAVVVILPPKAEADSCDFIKSDCYLPTHIDPCKPWPLGAALVWSWDVENNTCVEKILDFNCQPTRNYFNDYDECYRTAAPICHNLTL
ncbi:unnamed protein product [Diabrotica balteata]|uniref:Uncharacterized protein n=1 Tax=Diabrotica balteata TaxID=107213 RepID=A0A9N9XE82_DIABA|nr:unnamed protein product [Diabrotica balteata]